ncbi:MAG: hypothetical protein K2M88_05855 [Muribaculaceae bacterium]|nr:hypothetical protein [Muribaculaceae bacterium]
MKKFIKSLFQMGLLFVVLSTFNVNAQIPGKPYQIGDTIVMDNMLGMVYKIDETGLHGSAMSLPLQEDYYIKSCGSMLKIDLKKRVKKGDITAEQMETDLALHFKRVPPIPTQKAKDGLYYNYKAWSNQLPKGWRLPTSQDAEDICSPFTGGLGQENSIGGLSEDKLASKVTANFSFKWALKRLLPFGFIIEDGDGVAFIHNINKKGKQWFIVSDKYKGREEVIAVKDF